MFCPRLGQTLCNYVFGYHCPLCDLQHFLGGFDMVLESSDARSTPTNLTANARNPLEHEREYDKIYVFNKCELCARKVIPLSTFG